MGGLSGCAQRVLFNMLEEVALEGIDDINWIKELQSIWHEMDWEQSSRKSEKIYKSCTKYFHGFQSMDKIRGILGIYHYLMF